MFKMLRNPAKASGPGLSLSVLGITKPPKPPCWLDLRSSSDEGGGGSKHSPSSQTHPGVRPGKSTKRPRPKLHRTRSQACIEKDIPNDDLTVSLADANPEELGLCKVYDETIVMEATTRKCQNWLQGIEACHNVLQAEVTSPEEEVDVEVPDDTRWDDDADVSYSGCVTYSSSEFEPNVSLTGISPDILSADDTSTCCVVNKQTYKKAREKYKLRNSDSRLCSSPMHTSMKTLDS